MARKKHLFSWPGYFTKHLVSATVEDAADQNVVLTFAPSVKPFSGTIKESFTLVGKTVDLLTINYAACTATIRVTASYVAGANFDLTFDPTINPGKKGTTVVQEITNNVA